MKRIKRIKRYIVLIFAVLSSSLTAFSQEKHTIQLELPATLVVRPGTLSQVTYTILNTKGKAVEETPVPKVVNGSDLVRVSIDSQNRTFFIYGREDVVSPPQKAFITIVLTTDNALHTFTVPYSGEKEQTVKSTPTPVTDLTVDPTLVDGLDPGKSAKITVTAQNIDETGKKDGVKDQDLELEVEEGSKKYVGVMSAPGKTGTEGKKEFEVFRKALATGESFPDSVYLTAKLGKNFSKTVRIKLGQSTDVLDAKYYVMADGEAKRLFGKSVSRAYYAIGISVTSKTGDQYQISNVAFEKPTTGTGTTTTGTGTTTTGTGKPATTTTAEFGTVRASQERRNLTGFRTLLLTGISALGNLMTGFTPFFVNVGHRDRFTTWTNIITVPGFNTVNSVVPNTIPGELRNLEAFGMHGNSIVDRTEFKKVVFVSKGSVSCPGNQSGQSARTICAAPEDVEAALGKIVVDGIRVVPAAPTRLTP